MSKKIDENKNLLQRLGDLGLNDKEARIYMALLPYRDTGSSKIIRATGLHGQFVYDALSALEEKGLVSHVIRNGRKKFSASNPKRILALIEEKKLSAQSVVRQLQDRFVGTHEQDFEVYQGDDAFVAHQLEMLRDLPSDTTIDVIASQSEKYMATFDELGMSDEYEKMRIAKKIQVRYIGSEAQRARLANMDKNRPLWTYRILPGQSIGITSTEIHPKSVIFAVYGDPILDFTLLSKDVADGYREFFSVLWNMAKK